MLIVVFYENDQFEIYVNIEKNVFEDFPSLFNP